MENLLNEGILRLVRRMSNMNTCNPYLQNLEVYYSSWLQTTQKHIQFKTKICMTYQFTNYFASSGTKYIAFQIYSMFLDANFFDENCD